MAAKSENDTTTLRISRDLHKSLSRTVPKEYTYSEWLEENLEFED